MHLIHDIPPKSEDGIFRMVVESPKGSIGKFEVDKEFGVVGLDRSLKVPMPFPFEYGLIPGTWSEGDDDPVDIMVIHTESTFPGCLLHVRVIGMYEMMDSDMKDDKILGVVYGDELYDEVQDIAEMSSTRLRTIEFFWENYKKLTPESKIVGKGWADRKTALDYIQNSINHYEKKFK